MTVARQFLRLQRFSLVVWAGVMVLTTIIVAASVSAVTDNNAFQEFINSLPVGLQRLVGAHISNPVDAFIALKLLLLVPVLCGISGVMSAAAIVARERDRGTADFLLSLPLDRRDVLRRRFAAVAAWLAILYLVVWVTLVVAVEASGHSGSYGRYGLVLLAGFAVNLGQAGLVLALSQRLGDYRRTIHYALGLMLISYGLEMALKSAGALPSLRYILLYRLADPIELLLAGRVPWAALLVGAGLTSISLWWSQESFAHTELQA